MNPIAILQQFKLKVQNWFIPAEGISQSKQKWNELAKKNARYFVLSNYGEQITEECFSEEGKHDYEQLIASDGLLHQILGNYAERTMLEIGCGLGRLTQFLSMHFKEVIGVDISEEMLTQARLRMGKHPNVKLLVGNGQQLDVSDMSVDFVFSFIVFQHMPDVATVRSNLIEAARVLKPGGVAKIQLRGVEVSKEEWYYGPSFNHEGVLDLLKNLPIQLVREEGEGEKYYWITFLKK